MFIMDLAVRQTLQKLFVNIKYKSTQQFSKNAESVLNQSNIFSVVGELRHAKENLIILCEVVEWNANKTTNIMIIIINNKDNDGTDRRKLDLLKSLIIGKFLLLLIIINNLQLNCSY